MIYLITLCAFLVAFLGMAAGVLFNKKPLKGSCGGLASLPGHDGSSPCEFCSKPKSECPEYQEAEHHCADDGTSSAKEFDSEKMVF
jgi:hypothetical protein